MLHCMRLKSIALFLLLLLPVALHAQIRYDEEHDEYYEEFIKVGKLYYEFSRNGNDNIAKVACKKIIYYDSDESEGIDYTENDYEGELTIPSTVYYYGKTYNVTGIRDHAFRNCGKVSILHIPSTISYIGPDAFTRANNMAIVFDEDKAPSNTLKLAFTTPRGTTCVHVCPNQYQNFLSSVVDNPNLLKDDVVTSISFPQYYDGVLNTVTAQTGQTIKLVPEIPASKAAPAIAWELVSTNNLVSLSEDGTVTIGHKTGTAIVRVVSKYKKDVFADVIIEIQPNPETKVSSIKWDKQHFSNDAVRYKWEYSLRKPLTVDEGKSSLLLATIVSPADAYNKTIEWSSSDESIATVDGGRVTGVSFGTCKIYAKTTDGSNLSIEQEVYVAAKQQINDINYVLTQEDHTAGVYPCEVPEDDPSKDWYSEWHDAKHYRGDVEIPQEVEYQGEKYTVRAILDNAFAHCENLSSVRLPESIEALHPYAFYNCSELKDIYLPNSISEIGKSSFENCFSLKTFNFPTSLTRIESCSFNECAYEELIVPEGITFIGEGAFAYNRNLKYAVMPASVEKIERSIFTGCSNLSSVVVASSAPPTVITDEETERQAVRRRIAPVQATSASTHPLEGILSKTVYVQPASLNDYKSAENWSDIEDIKAIALGFDNSSETIRCGESLALKQNVTPSYLNVEWRSSNEEVATVDENGDVTALSPGTTSISASVYGIEATLQLEVTEASEVETTTITISAAQYSTYYNSKQAYVMPDDCMGYVFTLDRGLFPAYNPGDLVPADEPLVIHTLEPGEKTLLLTHSKELSYKQQGYNYLDGTDMETALVNDNNYYYYGLSLNSKNELASIGLYWMNADGSAFTNGAHKAYLKLEKSIFDNSVKAFVFDDMQTLISKTQTESKSNHSIFNLQGQRVNQAQKGIYILNGKKVIR